MPFWAFEACCLVIVLATCASIARVRGLVPFVREYVTVALAAWVGEESCIRLYGHYHYAPQWHAFVADVPLLVVMIWPLVVLSSREIAGALLGPHASPSLRALLVGALVTFDASFVEVIAVGSRLWSWSEPGYLGVPLIGMLGWGYFAGVADALLSSGRPRLEAPPMVVLLAPLGTHALIQATWWGLFRWVWRGDLGVAPTLVVAVLGGSLTLGAILMRSRGRTMPWRVAVPRIVASTLFAFIFVEHALYRDVRYVVHALAVALPYSILTKGR